MNATGLAWCPICDSPCQAYPAPKNSKYVECLRCGPYYLSRFGEGKVSNGDVGLAQRQNISSYISENFEAKINEASVEKLLTLRKPTVPERGEKLFRYLASKLPNPGDSISISFTDVRDLIARLRAKDNAILNPNGSIYAVAKSVLPLMAASWSQDHSELHYLLNDYLGGTKGLIERFSNIAYKISGRGWEYVSTDPIRESDIGFVAMNFAPEFDEVYQTGVEKGILAAGYRPVRIDRHPHVNRIDDEIIAQLRRSKFVVADFTGQRNGVYFEAGFALGLGLPVFWTCRSDDLKNVHFDTRQYNAIKWELADLNEFALALTNRIVAILGQGTYKSQ